MSKFRRLAAPAAGLVLLAVAGCGGAAESASTAPYEGSVWVANEGADSLSVLDARTGEVVATLSGIAAPHNVQATADGSAVLATSGAGAVVRVDGGDLTVTGHARTGGHPAHVVDDSNGNVYVTSGVERVIHRYDAALAPLGEVELVGAPHGLRLDGDGAVAVVANTGGGTIDVVDLGTGTVTQRVRVGSAPVQVAVTDDGTRAFVSVGSTNEVLAVDLSTGEIVARAGTPDSPAQILLAGEHLVVANQGTPAHPGDSVTFLDPDDLTVVGQVTTGSGPHGLTSDDTGTRVWVTNAFDGTVSVIDVPALRVVATVPVGAAPNGISFSPVTATAPAHDPMPLLLPHEIAHPADDGHSHDHGDAGGHGH